MEGRWFLGGGGVWGGRGVYGCFLDYEEGIGVDSVCLVGASLCGVIFVSYVGGREI